MNIRINGDLMIGMFGVLIFLNYIEGEVKFFESL